MESVKILAGSNLTQNYLTGKSMERNHGQNSKKIVLKTLMLSAAVKAHNIHMSRLLLVESAQDLRCFVVKQGFLSSNKNQSRNASKR